MIPFWMMLPLSNMINSTSFFWSLLPGNVTLFFLFVLILLVRFGFVLFFVWLFGSAIFCWFTVFVPEILSPLVFFLIKFKLKRLRWSSIQFGPKCIAWTSISIDSKDSLRFAFEFNIPTSVDEFVWWKLILFIWFRFSVMHSSISFPPFIHQNGTIIWMPSTNILLNFTKNESNQNTKEKKQQQHQPKTSLCTVKIVYIISNYGAGIQKRNTWKFRSFF